MTVTSPPEHHDSTTPAVISRDRHSSAWDPASSSRMLCYHFREERFCVVQQRTFLARFIPPNRIPAPS